MNRKLLPSRPCIANEGGFESVSRLVQNIGLAQLPEASRVVLLSCQQIRLTIQNLVHRVKPVIDQAHAAVVERCFDASATIMADYNDVPDLQDVHRVLDDRHAIHVGVLDDIRDVAMDENLARHQTRNLVGRDPAVRAPDPEKLRPLLLDQAIKELGIARHHRGGPLFVVLEQGFEKVHIDFVNAIPALYPTEQCRERRVLSHYPMEAYATMNLKIQQAPALHFKSLR
jgi:hypothetical protein